MGPVVLAFPGQGSLAAGAGTAWTGHASFAVVGAVGSASGVDVVELLTTAGDDELVSTENAQIATFALSLCVLDATGLAPVATLALGHSLGEYTALVAAGVLARDPGSRLVAARGAAMREAAEALPGGLVALLGGDLEKAETACATIDGLYLANLNGPAQVVVGGSPAALEELGARAKELGFRRAIPLKVGGAFHTPLMAPAARAFEPALRSASFSRGHATVLANVDGEPHEDPADWVPLLLRQLTEPVRFDACVRALPVGAAVVECGAGSVLKGLIARIREDLDVRSISTPEDVSLLEGLR
ncbi:MAG TPA: ACP S-malonyltransferase [Acidimicrobiales bacterium]|nr:ACP S-malonyltransferase [Acidimicrobiales bacterium]